ncbi:MAG: helix-turn-helix transcriptional regulator [Eubacteriales bacterium]|nr:helix-turn-helix transcriptional regulator [Eubacteriales bacterium]
MKRYSDCIRTDGMCGVCSLVNHGYDCHNNKLNGLLYQRTLCELKQRELAEKSGVNIRLIQKYESREYSCANMTLATAIALSDALECDVRDLL